MKCSPPRGMCTIQLTHCKIALIRSIEGIKSNYACGAPRQAGARPNAFNRKARAHRCAEIRPTALAPSPAVERSRRHLAGIAAALSAGAALSRRQSGLDAHAVALGERRARGEEFRAYRTHGGGA